LINVINDIACKASMPERGTTVKTACLLAIAPIGLALVPTAATARDQSPYVGVEGGLVFPQDTRGSIIEPGETRNRLEIRNKRGSDLDLVVGYDFGAIRAEAELGYKRMGIKSGEDADGDVLDIGGRTRILSLMGNALLDFGSDEGVNFSVGGGAGFARTRLRVIDDEGEAFPLKDNGFAWQLIAGARMALTPNVDVGLKYRYFRTKLNQDDFDIATNPDDANDARLRYRTHSLLASLIFNFGAAEAAPPPVEATPPPSLAAPPPPPPPATQTCPDGSVILATDACPVPPPPPPPPQASPERG
jgi:opacity protein-like surface antigen